MSLSPPGRTESGKVFPTPPQSLRQQRGIGSAEHPLRPRGGLSTARAALPTCPKVPIWRSPAGGAGQGRAVRAAEGRQGLGKMTTLTRQDLNFGQVVADVLSEFLEVAVHLILYVREVYPIGIFQKRKKYNVPVQMSCHPELNQYIQDTLHCVKPLLEKNDVEKVVVVILDKEHHPVERFVFEITQPPLLSISSESLLSHVEQLLRAFILKISVCDAVLDNNPPGCTFTVLVHTREAATRNMEKIQVIKDFPWILADEQDVHMHDPRLIPLKTMTSDILKMQLYVEERAHKGT
ncbi:mitotic spindle assembly checkpoint protein MAD2B isoform X1 [Anomalospiza imberbis]|uniref:mitotic spindle assembly checkpoint protein MAD2B isoform X1 n=1 Tax=Anomalospiza imberbis TaxID=187417 RepID=UPI00358F7964